MHFALLGIEETFPHQSTALFTIMFSYQHLGVSFSKNTPRNNYSFFHAFPLIFLPAETTNQSPELCLELQAFKRPKEKRHSDQFDYKVRSSVSFYIKFMFLPAGENKFYMKTQDCQRLFYFPLHLVCSISVYQGIFKLVIYNKICFIHVHLLVVIHKFKFFVVFTRHQKFYHYSPQLKNNFIRVHA